jgi:hypothetical protein
MSNISTQPIIIMTRDGRWIAHFGDPYVAQICMDALSGFPGELRLHEVPCSRPPVVTEANNAR